MVCIYCGGKTEIINSRRQKRNNQVWRRRRCLTCQTLFTSHEVLDYRQTLRIDKGGALEPFYREKLFIELQNALQDRVNPYTDAEEITSSIIAQLLKLPSRPVFKVEDVVSVAGRVLKRFDNRAWQRYRAEHPSLL